MFSKYRRLIRIYHFERIHLVWHAWDHQVKDIVSTCQQAIELEQEMIVENINKALFTSTGQVEDSKETQEILGRFMSPQISILSNLLQDSSRILRRRRHWKKVPMIAWETSLFNGWTHTHTSYFTERFATIKFWQGKNLSKRFNFNKKWRKTPKGTHCSIHWRRWWKSTVS